MFINIHIYSKNYKSIELFSTFFSNKTFTEKLKITTFSLPFQNPVKKKIFTVLKSPHVNKTAQEHFEYNLYTKQFKICSHKGFLLLTFLKNLKYNLFPDIKFKIEVINQNLKFGQKLKNKVNSDNFSLSHSYTGLKTYIQILNSYDSLSKGD
jgi:ribosomal protein S10